MKRMRGLVFLFFVVISGVFLFGCGAGVTTTSLQTTEKNFNEVAKYEGPKARIAVASFKCKAAKCYGQIGSGIRDMLVDALVRTGKFIVVERGEGLEEIKKELELGQSGLVQPEKAPQIGQLEGADILVVGSIIAFEPNAGGISGGVGGLIPKVPLLGGLKLGKKEAYIALTLRFIDVRTGRILNSTRIEGKASSFNVGGLGGGILGTIPLGGGLEVYKNTPMEKAVMVLIDNAVKAIEKYVPEEYYRYGEGKTKTKTSAQTTAKVQPSQTKPVVTPKPVEKEPIGSLVFFETFENYGIGQTAPFGRWEGNNKVSVKQVVQVNGQIGKAANLSGDGNICIKDLKLKNFILELDFIKSWTDFGVRFRIQKNPFSGYSLVYDDDKFRLYKLAGDMKVKIAENKGNFRTMNKWSHLKLVVNGSNIRAYANNNDIIIDITDNDPSMVREGMICIYSHHSYNVIDNIKIYSLDKDMDVK